MNFLRGYERAAPSGYHNMFRAAVFVLCAAVRLLCTYLSQIPDCDEVFNYWEPLHYVLFGSGLQTWEYAPTFALRSYAYLVSGFFLP